MIPVKKTSTERISNTEGVNISDRPIDEEFVTFAQRLTLCVNRSASTIRQCIYS